MEEAGVKEGRDECDVLEEIGGVGRGQISESNVNKLREDGGVCRWEEYEVLRRVKGTGQCVAGRKR